MVINDFPIGQALTAVSIFEDKEFVGSELCCDKVQLFFENTALTLLPITDTDEIEITLESNIAVSTETPFWCQSLREQKADDLMGM